MLCLGRHQDRCGGYHLSDRYTVLPDVGESRDAPAPNEAQGDDPAFDTIEQLGTAGWI
jgi:hypothetical protein